MSNKIIAIGPKDAISCFAAIGAELRVAKEAGEVSARLAKAAREKDVALVLAPDLYAADCGDAIKAFRAESSSVLLLLPLSLEGPDLALDEIGKQIEKAVGMNLLKTQS